MRNRLTLSLILAFALAAALVPVHGNPYFSFQVGAWGDNSSIGNHGVQAQIQTIVQPLQAPDLADAYWVGDNLQGGAFIQLGYTIMVGSFCTHGYQPAQAPGNCDGITQQFSGGETEWFWQYWPNIQVNSYYFAMGPGGSVGMNGTWNTYIIQSSRNNSWSFILNGQPVDHLNIAPIPSLSAAYMEAEKVSSSPNTGVLGPVEFRNLQYYTGTSWEYVKSLLVLRGCGSVNMCAPSIPFGVEALSNNDILAGSDEPQITDHSLLTQGGISPNTSIAQSVNNSIYTTLNETSLILQEFNQSTLLQQVIERATLTQQELNGTSQVIIIVPSMIHVTIDGVEEGSGPVVQLQLSQGTHTISVPAQLEVNGTNVQFAGWMDASGLIMGQPTMTIDFTANLVIQANYQPVWST